MKDSFPRAFTVLYLLIPAFFFAVGWLKLPVMIVTLIVLTVFAGLTLTDIVPALRTYWANRREIFRSLTTGKAWMWILLALGFVFAWMSLAGIGGIGHQNGDYNLKNPIFKALISQDWPVRFTISGSSVPLVYYIGYYLPAAFAGKLLGWVPANQFLFLWAGIGVFLSLYWFYRLSRVNLRGHAFKIILVAILFCLASGMDYIGYYVWAKHLYNVTEHIEYWTNLFEYSGNTSLIYWVPQQAIAGWLLTGLLVDGIFNFRTNKYTGIAIASSILWSPFAALGTVPFFILLLVKYSLSGLRSLLFSRGLLFLNLLSIWVAGIHASFILANRFSFPVGFVWQLAADSKTIFRNLIAFYLLEFAILGFLVLFLLLLGYIDSSRHSLSADRTIPKRIGDSLVRNFQLTPLHLGVFLLVFLLLWVIPLFQAGLFNDLVMRISIPCLIIFWAFVAKIILDAGARIRSKFTLVFSAILIVVMIGFATDYSEIIRAAIHFNTAPDAWSWVKDISVAAGPSELEQIAGNEESFFFREIGK